MPTRGLHMQNLVFNLLNILACNTFSFKQEYHLTHFKWYKQSLHTLPAYKLAPDVYMHDVQYLFCCQ